MFGLRSDLAWIEERASNPEDVSWGIPLSAAEAADMKQRMTVQLGLTALEFLHAKPWYGGLWIDQHASGEVVVNSAGQSDETAESLATLLPDGAFVRIQPVAYSMATLEALKARADALVGAGEGRTLGVQSVGIDEMADKLRIGLNPYSISAAETLQAMYPADMLAIVPEEPIELVSCFDRTQCYPPMSGGLQIGSSNGLAPVNCTAGFLGRPTGGTPTTGYIITSGHCVHTAGLGATFTTNFSALGTVWRDNFYSGSSADVGVIKSSLAWSPANTIMPSLSVYRAVTSTIHDASQPQNGAMCKSSWPSNTTCGSIIQVNHTVDVTGATLYGQWEMTTGVQKGDSGGPVYYSFGAAGIIVANQNSSTWYSTMDHVASQIGYRPCYVSTYPC